MRVWEVAVQLLIALVITALALPGVLANVPLARSPRGGLLAATAILAVAFGLILLLWPRRKL